MSSRTCCVVIEEVPSAFGNESLKFDQQRDSDEYDYLSSKTSLSSRIPKPSEDFKSMISSSSTKLKYDGRPRAMAGFAYLAMKSVFSSGKNSLRYLVLDDQGTLSHYEGSPSNPRANFKGLIFKVSSKLSFIDDGFSLYVYEDSKMKYTLTFANRIECDEWMAALKSHLPR